MQRDLTLVPRFFKYIVCPLLVKPDDQGLSSETRVSRGGFTPENSRWGNIGQKVCLWPEADSRPYVRKCTAVEFLPTAYVVFRIANEMLAVA